jgi:tetratricopeptide (TPR) repeat protein
MSTPPAAHSVPLAWGERAAGEQAAGSPRSQRDLEILRGLARRINPNDAGAHNNLGVVYYNKGLYEDAVQHFEHALEIDPRMQVAERNLQIAYFGTGYFERLVAQLTELLDRNPDDTEARDQLARALYNSGDNAGAIRELRQLLVARPDDAALYQRLARAELKRGDLDVALTALRHAEAHDQNNARVKFMIGEALYQRGRSAEAREPLERAIALDPRLADAYHLLAFVYGDLGEVERANRAAMRASELNPSYAKAEAGLSIDSYSTKRFDELVGDRAATPAVAEGGELAHYNLGLAFRQQALYDEALREFRLATERGEDTFLVRQAEAEMLLLRGDSQEALALYEELTQQESSSPKLWNELGVSHHQIGSLVEAERGYRRSLEIDPNYALAWNNLAVVRHHRGMPDAENAFRSALREPRVPADVWRNFALMLHRDGRRDESAAAYERALQISPDNAAAETGLGELLLEMKRVEEARAHLLRAVEIDPRMAEARYHLAFALSALGDYPGALRETRLALELNPYIPTPRFKLLIDLQFEEASVLAPELDPAARIGGDTIIEQFHFQSGVLDSVFGGAQQAAEQRTGGVEDAAADMLRNATASMERGMLEQALTEAQRAAMYGAPRTDVLLLQGDIYLRRGLSGEAVERFNEALAEIARNGTVEGDDALRRALLGAARSLLDLDRLPEAVEAAERVCALAPDNVEAMRTLGEALGRAEDHARAAMVLERARIHAPADPALLTQLGAAYAAAGDPEAAETALRRSIAQDPRGAAARVQLGKLLISERPDEAEREFREALKLLPTYGDAAFSLAALYELHGRLHDAVVVVVDLLSADPYQLDALMRLGELLNASGMVREARFAFERVLRYNPNDARARGALGRLLTPA